MGRASPEFVGVAMCVVLLFSVWAGSLLAGGVANAAGVYRFSLREGGLPEARGVVISPATANKQV